MTQDEFGKIAGRYSQDTVARWEAGAVPHALVLKKIADASGYSVDAILGRAELTTSFKITVSHGGGGEGEKRPRNDPPKAPPPGPRRQASANRHMTHIDVSPVIASCLTLRQESAGLVSSFAAMRRITAAARAHAPDDGACFLDRYGYLLRGGARWKPMS